ncbi:GNAT family N-acetyltransferase [Nonomuraea sp. LPB2021202275-12-8]|uniref:GNAT family N-acetyltransferase n=1 Tax=Nonomuraea sp. LPB2021202275-12-8 TaxID=3120159 RepID=UPI00300CF115
MTVDRFYSSRRWLGFCAAMSSVPAGAVTAELSGGGLAALPVSVVSGPTQPFYDWTAILAARELPAPGPFGLLAGPQGGYQTHLLATPGADQGEVGAALRAALEEVGLPAMAMYLTTSDAAALGAAGVEALPVLLGADAWLPVPEEGWQAWTRSLGRSRGEMVRREIRRFESAGYEIVDAPLSDWVGQAAALLAGTEARYGHGGDYQRALTEQVRHLGSAARVICCNPPGEPPVGFVLYYVHGDTLHLRSAGFDYERLRGAAEYFNLVFYLPIRRAAAAGVRWVHAGIESTQAKAMRGAELRPLWLLDLSPGSLLGDRPDAVRTANSRTRASISATPFLDRCWRLGDAASAWFEPRTLV